MKPIATEWSISSDAGLPVWIVVPGLVIVAWIMLRWLRAELGSRGGVAARLLPLTLASVLLAAAVLLWRPVLARMQTWRHEAKQVVVVDASQSMKTPLGPESVSGGLDLAAVWDEGLCAGRSLAAREFRRGVEGLLDEARGVSGRLQAVLAAVDQDLPAATEAATVAASATALQQRSREVVGAGAAGVQPLLSGPLAVASTDLQSAAGEAVARVEKAAAGLVDVPQATEASGAADATSLMAALAALLTPLEEFTAAATAVVPTLDALQEAADARFVATEPGRLEPAVAAARARSRRELGRQAVARIADHAIVEDSTGDTTLTDLYAMVAEALARREDDVVSHCVLVSDGGHNGGGDPGVMRRLAKQGVKFIAVGAGIPGPQGFDPAIVDWRLPRMLKAGKQAVLQASVKAPAGSTFTLRLSEAEQTLASSEVAAGPDATTAVSLSFKPPAEGRHVFTLAVESEGDINPANNRVVLQADCVGRERPVLLVGTVPSWDDAWLAMAATRQGCPLSQLYTAGDEPKRGSLSRAIPASLLQWTRYRGVILDGPVFKGFKESDAVDLRRFVAERGGTLFVFADDPAGFGPALAAGFGWEWKPPAEVAGPLRLAAAAAATLPCLRLDIDGPQSVRRFAELPAPARAVGVPRQDVVLIESSGGEPVCSLGFHGRGKVILWGIRGLHRMREYQHAPIVDRLLDGMIDEVAASLFPDGSDAGIAVYPPLPRIGSRCHLVAAPSAQHGGADHAAAEAKPADGAAVVALVPTQAEEQVAVGGGRFLLRAHDNPGAEQSRADFDESFLRGMAGACGGDYVTALAAAPVLESLKPQTSITRTTDTWPIGRSPVLFAFLVIAATAHWVARKLAGLTL